MKASRASAPKINISKVTSGKVREQHFSPRTLLLDLYTASPCIQMRPEIRECNVLWNEAKERENVLGKDLVFGLGYHWDADLFSSRENRIDVFHAILTPDLWEKYFSAYNNFILTGYNGLACVLITLQEIFKYAQTDIRINLPLPAIIFEKSGLFFPEQHKVRFAKDSSRSYIKALSGVSQDFLVSFNDNPIFCAGIPAFRVNWYSTIDRLSLFCG